MPSPADDSARTLGEARAVLVRQRSGRPRSIGRGSAEMRARHWRGKVKRIVAAVVAIVLAAIAAGIVVGGIGLGGLMLAVLAGVVLVGLLAVFPRMPTPRLDQLNKGDARSLVARTELWLEAQRPALPAPAVQLVDHIGVQLDGLGLQLDGIDPAHPAAEEVRKLVGEHLPAMVDSYRRIPTNLRAEDRGGRTADQQLADGLGKISTELDEVTRKLAAGDLDSLAIRGRYLDYRYGGELDHGERRLMRIAIPHSLNKADVRQRLTERSGEIANFIPGGFADVESDWVDDDHMALGITAMGSFVGADIAVEDKQIVVEVELPKKLAFVKGTIERSIRENATKLLK